MPKPMYVWSGTAWVSVASEVESLANFATQSYADSQPGMKLIVPSSVAVGSGSGSVATQGTVSFSGASSVSLNNVFSSTYDSYKIIVDCLPSTTLDLNMRLRVGGSDNSTSNYNRQYLLGNSTTVSAARSTGQNLWAINGGASAHRQLLDMTIVNPALSLSTGMYLGAAMNYDNTGALIVIHNGYSFSATTTFDGLSLFVSTGTMSGTIRVYGYKAG